MNIQEIIDCVDGAVIELEGVNIMDLPDNLREDFSQAYGLLLHISTVLDLEMELEMEEWE